MKPALFFIISFMMLQACTSNSGSESAAGQSSKSESPAFVNAEKAEEIFSACIACHGGKAQGLQAMNAPAIAGQEEWYLAEQMKNFKNGMRGAHPDDIHGAQMAAIAKTLSDDDIVQVAGYIKTLPSVATEKTMEGDIRKGESKYNMICGACHGAGAKGNKSLNAPRLAGMDDWYVKRQLLNYINGVRGAHPDDTFGAQMAPMAKTLEDEQAVNDVAAYLQSLQNVPL